MQFEQNHLNIIRSSLYVHSNSATEWASELGEIFLINIFHVPNSNLRHYRVQLFSLDSFMLYAVLQLAPEYYIELHHLQFRFFYLKSFFIRCTRVISLISRRFRVC